MNNPWQGITGSNFGVVRITNNEAENTDTLINFASCTNLRYVFTNGNINYGGTTVAFSGSANDPSNNDNGRGIYFQELMYIPVTSLPDPRVFINAAIVSSFIGQIVSYQGALYVNDNEQWRLVDGSDFGTAAPATGSYTKGQKRWNSNSVSGQPLGWVCTASGTMDAINTTCTATGTNVVTVALTSGLKVGQWIKINGAVASQITAINYSNSQVTMSGTVTSGSGVTFVNSAATFSALANIV
jgi:hypothetical protein